MSLKYKLGSIICKLSMSHVQRIWKIKNPNYNPETITCMKGVTTNFFTRQIAHNKNCACEYREFYLCKRCGKDITHWNKYKPNPEYEWMECNTNQKLEKENKQLKKVIDEIKQLMVHGKNHWTILDIQQILSKLGDKK